MSTTPYPRGRRRRAVSATEAAKNLGRLVDRVREDGVTWTIERGGTPVAELGPVTRSHFTIVDFKALVENLPKADGKYLDAVERTANRHNVPKTRKNPWAR